MDDIYYLSLDPGERNTGWAGFREDGSDLGFGVIAGGLDAFTDWLEDLNPKPKEIIYEGYAVNPNISHAYSKVLTVQVIGAIKSYCRRNKIPKHEMRSVNLKVALRMVGCYSMYYDKHGKNIKHVDDRISAYAHGVWFLTKNGIRKSRLSK